MKKVTAIFLTLILMFVALGSIPANASEVSKDTQIQIEYLKNGDRIVTVIEDATPDDTAVSPLATTKTITKTKTRYYQSNSGTNLWSASITATFTYDGSTSKCTSCSHSAAAYAQYWSIKSVSSSKSGNSATTDCVATYTYVFATDYSMSVTITCSANGTIS